MTTLNEKLVQHLNNKIDSLREQLRSCNSIIKDQEELIKELTSYLLTPSYKAGDIVKVLGIEDNLYKIEDFMYDQSYPIYNLININDANDIQSIPEIDLYK